MAVNALPGRLVKKVITGRMPFCHTHTPAVLSAPNTVPTMSPKVETIWPGSRVKNPTTASTASVKIFFTSSNTLPKNLTMVPQCLISSMTPSTMRAMTPMMIIMGTTIGDSAPSTMNSETAHTVNAVASTPPMTMARAMATSLCFSSQVTAFWMAVTTLSRMGISFWPRVCSKSSPLAFISANLPAMVPAAADAWPLNLSDSAPMICPPADCVSDSFFCADSTLPTATS